MSKITTILNNATVPAGEFGTTATDGVRGVLQFTNDSEVPGKIKVRGSNDGKHFGKANRPLRAAAGQTVIRGVRLPATLKFFNPNPPFGPATIILNSESEED